MAPMTNTPTSRVTELTARELDRFAASHPRSGELRDAAEEVLLSGVPMNWMTRWPGAWPVVFECADGAGGRVERRRGARARALLWRRRLRPGRAGADQHRHRARRGRLPRADARADAGD